MKTYKAIHLLNENAKNELNSISSLFSEKESLISYTKESEYACVAFTPDVYLKNKVIINNYFSKNYFAPLVMTNYKFLSLLLMIAENPDYTFKDFSFREDGYEGDHEKEFVEELILGEKNLQKSFNFLESKDQNIKFIELEVCNSNNRLRIYSSGNIAVSRSFDEQDFPYIINLVKYLFIGRIDKL